VKKRGRAREATDDNITRRMRFACWITNVADPHSDCVTIVALPQQQWLLGPAPFLRYTYIAFPVFYGILFLT
jgi:hypothetical protein